MNLLNSPTQVVETQKTFREKEPFILEIKGKHFIYDTNSMGLFQVEKDVFKLLDLQSLCVKEAPYWLNCEEPKHKGYLVFQATYACNLACNYCFVKHHYTDHTNSMQLQTAIDAINTYQSDWKNQGFRIGFFGGEPLMNWEFIYQLVEWCKEQAKKVEGCLQKCSWHITTNGTLITEEIAEYLAQNGFSLIISLDGLEEDHNEARPYAGENKANSWKDTMRGVEFIAKEYKKVGKNNPVTLRSTFDKNGCDLVSRLKFLNQIMYDGKAGHVSVEPSCLAESCARSTFEGLQESEIIAKFEEQYFLAADWFLSELKAGRKPSFHHFEVPLQRLYDREAAPCECGAGKGYLSIGPNGKVAACHREHESVIGNMYEGIDKTKQAAWSDNRYFNRIGCNDCWMRNFCGGGCRCNSALLYKNLQQPSKIECIFKAIQANAVIYLMSEMTEEQRKMYSKNKNQYGIRQGKEAENKVCSDPNNCEPCKTKLQKQNCDCNKESGKKQQAVCGLKVCEGENCPFTHCGKQTPEEFQAGLKKLNGGKE